MPQYLEAMYHVESEFRKRPGEVVGEDAVLARVKTPKDSDRHRVELVWASETKCVSDGRTQEVIELPEPLEPSSGPWALYTELVTLLEFGGVKHGKCALVRPSWSKNVYNLVFTLQDSTVERILNCKKTVELMYLLFYIVKLMETWDELLGCFRIWNISILTLVFRSIILCSGWWPCKKWWTFERLFVNLTFSVTYGSLRKPQNDLGVMYI